MNCGLAALEKIAQLKNVSAFTLIHLGRDNDLNLYFFKVNDLKDLVRVQRPAIFHQKDHFVYVKNGEAMPDGEYTGHVIGPAVLGRVLSMAEAKTVNGGKNFLTGKNSDGDKVGNGALGTILSVVAATVGNIIAPGSGFPIGATIGGALGGGVGNTITGDNPLIGAATGALEGFGVGKIGGALGAGASTATKTGTQAAFQNAISGGIGSGIGATAPSAASGAAGLAGASGAFGNAVSNAVGSGVGTATAPSFTPSAFNPSFSLSSIPLASGSGASAPSASTVASGASNNGLLANIGKTATSAIGKSFTDNPIGSAAALAGGVGVFGSKAPAYTAAAPAENYSAVQQFLGKDPATVANTNLAQAGSAQNLDYVNTSIQDLQKQFTGNNDRTMNSINTAYDNQRQQLTHQYAQAGQNLANSSELQDKVNQLEQKRTNDVTLAQQELQDQALGQAIQVKQQALSQAMQAGQWNQTLAYQLASLTGDQQNLQYAIANNDYTSFQQIMGKLMTMGIPQTVKIT